METNLKSKIYCAILTKYDPSWSPPYEIYSIDIVPQKECTEIAGEKEDGTSVQIFVGTKEECQQFEQDYNRHNDPDYQETDKCPSCGSGEFYLDVEQNYYICEMCDYMF